MNETVVIGGTPKGERPRLDGEVKRRLLALGLNEDDLAFMGPVQREMVEAVLQQPAPPRHPL